MRVPRGGARARAGAARRGARAHARAARPHRRYHTAGLYIRIERKGIELTTVAFAVSRLCPCATMVAMLF